MNRNDIIKELEAKDSSILSFPNRGEWGDKRYRGNCSGWIQAFLIWKYRIDRKFAELFSGSGTGYDVCKDMGIDYVGADLNPNPVRPGILNVNAVTDEVPDLFRDAQMLFMHPPYGAEIGIPYAGAEWGAEKKWEVVNGRNKCNIIDHTSDMIPTLGYDPKKYDLGRMSWNTFMRTLNGIIMKYYAAMAPGSYMGILMGDVRRNGVFHSMMCDIVKPGIAEQVIIKEQHNCVSNGRSYTNRNFVPIEHEYLYVLKKTLDAFFINYQLPSNFEKDLRDSKSATWKDIVMAALQNTHKEYALEEIYNAVENHERTKQNVHWQDKIRQVMRELTASGMVVNVKRGYYAAA